jgi:hypothetical protein
MAPVHDPGVDVAPAGVDARLVQAVPRAMRRLPDPILLAMSSGLRAHCDELVPRTLFRGRSGGGCAVGVTLRELVPEAFEFGRLRFWLWHRWRRGIERDVAARYPQLKHLQWHFDDAVRGAADELPDQRDAARAVGLWLAASAAGELALRRPPEAPARGIQPPRPWRASREHSSDREAAGGSGRRRGAPSACVGG